jgi:hypothetical protein
MQISKIVTDGSTREEALKRRNNAMREALGMKPAPSRNASEPQEAKTDETLPSTARPHDPKQARGAQLQRSHHTAPRGLWPVGRSRPASVTAKLARSASSVTAPSGPHSESTWGADPSVTAAHSGDSGKQSPELPGRTVKLCG